MAKKGKKYREALTKIDRDRVYPLPEAIEALKEAAFAGFDETVELVISLGIDPRKSDQMVRGTVSLPHGTGKKVTVLVFCEPDQEDEALAAGADFAGSDELVEKIQGGWMEFDVAVATKKMMRTISRLGKVLGPRGLMPNPKAGTLTDDIPAAVKELKAGKIEFRSNKYGDIQVAVGKISFTPGQLIDNIRRVISEINRLRPAAVKGKYLKKAYTSTTMSPPVKLEVAGIGA